MASNPTRAATPLPALAAFAAAWLLALPGLSAGQTSAPPPSPAAAPPSAPAPGPGVFHIHPASGPITIDGVLDDPGWRDALEITEFYEVSPGDNAPPRVRTRCRLAYDRDHLYFMARCYDPAPAKIRAHVTDRDQVFDDDMVGLMLDTFQDHRTGYEFFVNPRGIQGDLSRNGDQEDASFDCLWQSAARIDSLGWTAEFAVPTRSIRFRSLDIQKWGFTAFRLWPRESRYQIASVRLDRNNPCLACQFAVLNEFHGLSAGKNLEVLPSLTLTSASTRGSLDGPRTDDTHPAVGVNLKYGITPSLTLDGTVHPDFAQVEADQNQVSVNSQSALFFQEKRPFFMEGSTIFQSTGQFFYSRSVADPRWAGKVTGRAGRFQLAVLAARDRSTQVIYPYLGGSEALDLGTPSTDAVVRGKLGLHQESYLGFTGTARSFQDGHNVMGALDGQIRFLKRLRWTGYLAVSHTRDLPGIADNADSSGAAHAGWGTYQELFYFSRNYNGGFYYTEKSRRYRTDLGYQDQNDLDLLESWHEWDFQPAGRVVEFWRPALYAGYQLDHNGKLREQVVRPDLYARFKGQWSAQAQFAVRFSRYFNPDLPKEVATHRNVWYVGVDKNGSGLLTGGAQVTAGEAIYRRLAVLGRSTDVTGYLTLRPSSRLTVSVQGELYRINDHGVDTALVRQSLGLVRLTYQFTPRLFVRLLGQYQRVESPYQAPEQRSYNQLANQFLLSYKLNYASVFFLGLNGNYDDGLAREDGTVPPVVGAPFVQTSRQVFLKFQYLWRT